MNQTSQLHEIPFASAPGLDYVLDIERELAGQQGTVVRRALIEQFTVELARLNQIIDRGLSLHQFQAVQSVVGAIEAALRIVETVKPSRLHQG